jgi:hypothetical protein
MSEKQHKARVAALTCLCGNVQETTAMLFVISQIPLVPFLFLLLRYQATSRAYLLL